MSSHFALIFLLSTGAAFIAAVISLFSGELGAATGLFILSAISNGVAKHFEAGARIAKMRTVAEPSSPVKNNDPLITMSNTELKKNAQDLGIHLDLLDRYVLPDMPQSPDELSTSPEDRKKH